LWGFQQAAEKGLKAMLLMSNHEVPRTHDIAFLVSRLRESWPEADSLRDEALALSEITPAVRYPGDWPELLPEEMKRMETAAVRIVAWVGEQVVDLEGGPE
jgi:HEPN domain-containing protein